MSDNIGVSAMDISASALVAQRQRMKIIAGNIANANTMIGADGEPFKKREVTFGTMMKQLTGAADPAGSVAGVEIRSVTISKQPHTMEYRPGHPQADPETGFVKMPNVNITEEMVEMVSAQRAYEANLAAMKSYRDMLRSSLSILK